MKLHEVQFPVKVVFKKTLFEDDFVEEGMIASFTGYEYNEDIDCCVLFFNFEGFEEHNLKLFKDAYYPNKHTGHDGRIQPSKQGAIIHIILCIIMNAAMTH